MIIYIYIYTNNKKLQIGGASWWRVCYQRGDPVQFQRISTTSKYLFQIFQSFPAAVPTLTRLFVSLLDIQKAYILMVSSDHQQLFLSRAPGKQVVWAPNQAVKINRQAIQVPTRQHNLEEFKAIWDVQLVEQNLIYFMKLS